MKCGTILVFVRSSTWVYGLNKIKVHWFTISRLSLSFTHTVVCHLRVLNTCDRSFCIFPNRVIFGKKKLVHSDDNKLYYAFVIITLWPYVSDTALSYKVKWWIVCSEPCPYIYLLQLPLIVSLPLSNPLGLNHSNIKMEAPVACTLNTRIRHQEG